MRAERGFEVCSLGGTAGLRGRFRGESAGVFQFRCLGIGHAAGIHEHFAFLEALSEGSLFIGRQSRTEVSQRILIGIHPATGGVLGEVRSGGGLFIRVQEVDVPFEILGFEAEVPGRLGGVLRAGAGVLRAGVLRAHRRKIHSHVYNLGGNCAGGPRKALRCGVLITPCAVV